MDFKTNTPRIIAYYLPQYHPTKENNEWWGDGFTEWTNVGKARPLFRGHYQPKVPRDLGYYDLRLPEIREQQVKLAKEAGVAGFCYWHYWFGEGKQLLNEIIDEVHESGKPDFPFCLGWANEGWKAKEWGKRGKRDKTLIDQVYGGIDDYEAHFTYVLRLFKDDRYIKIDNKPIFLIYRPQFLPTDFIPYWQKRARDSGLNGICFVAKLDDKFVISDFDNRGFDYYTRERYNKVYSMAPRFRKIKIRVKSFFYGVKVVLSYGKYYKQLVDKNEDLREDFIPSMMPNWDHSPRSGRNGHIYINSTPSSFFNHACDVLREVKVKRNKLIFLKSWNEWGEGNYMEPDLKFGKGYITALKEAIRTVEKEV